MGEKKNTLKAIYMSQTHRCLLSKDNTPSSMLGTGANTEGTGKHPHVLRAQLSAVKLRQWTSQKGPTVKEGTTLTMAMRFRKSCRLEKLEAED